MLNNPNSLNHRFDWVVVFVCLASLYMLTYSGRIESADTLQLTDAVGSVARYGDFNLDLAVGERPPLAIRLDPRDPLPAINDEPLGILLAVPLYLLADALPGIGLIHAVYLLNVLVTAGLGVVFYGYARLLDYSRPTALGGALLLGGATIFWPYSKSFFQEPMIALWLLLAALVIERWRRLRYRSLVAPLAAGMLFSAAVLTKSAALIALPGLLLLALPPGLRPRALILLGAGLAGLLLLLDPLLGISHRALRIFDGAQFFGVAFQAYLLSPGGSLWGTSPILLLALPGGWLLLRAGRPRYALAALVFPLSFALVYAAVHGPHWFGGLSWPPRFLIPAVPFVMLAALPALDVLIHRASPALRSAAALLIAWSIWVQLSGVTLDWAIYADALPLESGGLIEWGGGLNELRWLRPVVIPGLWGGQPLDIAWARVDRWAAALPFAALSVAALIAPWRGRRALIAAGLALAWIGAVYIGLRTIYLDPFYRADDPDLWAAMDQMIERAAPGDIALLNDLIGDRNRFFLNYGKFDWPRVVSLPFQPGEQPSPDQPPQVTSPIPHALLSHETGPLLHALAGVHDRLWLLANNGPFIPWSVRPVERFLAAHYYPAGEVEVSARARLIEYSTVSAPSADSFREPERPTDFRFEGDLRLGGFDLPRGEIYRPGEYLPLSLYWWAAAPLAEDVIVATFLRDAAGLPAVDAWNGPPAGGFAHSSGWTPGVPVWDHRALRLPPDLPPGAYQLWVLVYTRGVDETINHWLAAGGDVRDESIAVLPVTITVEEGA